jgi:feruloyl esterase
MVPLAETATNTLSTAGDYQWSWDFPSFMSDLGATTGITNRNMEFTRASYDRLTKLHGLYDPTNSDLTTFAARGGRLVMWHG